jgi:hypothetical protein
MESNYFKWVTTLLAFVGGFILFTFPLDLMQKVIASVLIFATIVWTHSGDGL